MPGHAANNMVHFPRLASLQGSSAHRADVMSNEHCDVQNDDKRRPVRLSEVFLWGFLALGTERLAGTRPSWKTDCTEVTASEVRVGEVLSDPFEVTTGLRQGCVLSLLLFSLYNNGMVEKLREATVGVRCKERVPALLFAADMAILAEGEEELRRGC